MDIAGLSMDLANISTMSKVGTAVLGKTLDTNEALGAGLVEMIDAAAMERSVNPAVGGQFDLRVYNRQKWKGTQRCVLFFVAFYNKKRQKCTNKYCFKGVSFVYFMVSRNQRRKQYDFKPDFAEYIRRPEGDC